MSQTRADRYRKAEQEEGILARMNEALASLSEEIRSSASLPDFPCVFIVGCQRSGTTLLMQMLAATGEFGYFSNLGARFWKAPFLGATLHQALAREGFPNTENFCSDLGYTKGCFEPHEASYFWKRWFPLGQSHRLNREALGKVDWESLRRELGAMQMAFEGKPLLFKNPIHHDFHIAELAREIPDARFIHITREPAFVAQSTLEARNRFHESGDGWFGPVPPGLEGMVDESPELQVVSQIFRTRELIAESFLKLTRENGMEIAYEELAADPSRHLDKLLQFCLGEDCSNRSLVDLSSLRVANKIRIPEEQFRTVSELCDQFSRSASI